jgi:phage major head subunit gpT-like protein
MSVQTRGDNQRLLQEGVDAVAGTRMKMYDPQWKAFLEEKTDNSAYATEVYKSTLGIAQAISEGGEVVTDTSRQLYAGNFTHAKYGLAVEITEEAIEDNLYENEMKEAGMYLADSLMEVEQVIAADLINSGYTSALAKDGQFIFDTDHPLASGTFSNRLSSYQSLSEASLEDVCNAIGKFENAAGLKTVVKPVGLCVPVDLQFTAARLLQSTLQAETGNNAINAVSRMFSKGYSVNNYFTDTGQWFVTTDVRNGGSFYRRTPHRFQSDNSNTNTGNYRHTGKTRFSVGVTDPRFAYGSGASA